MMNVRNQPNEQATVLRVWVQPRVTPLPRLTELTLQTGGGIPGECGGGGSTCF
jgi:hypothetical protein